MGIPATQWIKHPTSGTTRFSDFSVGDTIMITGSSHNNGIYTVNAITDGGGYSYMALTGPTITTDDDDSSVNITRIGTAGNKLVCLGDEDTGTVDIWSYSESTDEDGSSAVSPSVGANGWSTSAITPVMVGNNAQFIFTQADDTIRVCDTSEANTSIIKHYGYIQRQPFGNSKGGLYSGFEEHLNTLNKPSRGGYMTYAYNAEQAYGIEDDAGTALTDKFDIRRWLKVTLDTGVSDKAANTTDNKLQPDDQTDAANIPIGAVLGFGQDDDNDKTTSILPERFLVRKNDLTGSDDYNITTYRGYAGTSPAAVDVSANSFIYQYGCGWNFKVAENGTANSGTYLGKVYEFAQSFIYDDNQESLLRTDTDITSANTLTTSNDLRALDIVLYAHGPYPGRVTGGRLYIRQSGTNEPWSLLVDIDIERGCRTGLDAQYITWSDASGDGDVPNGCFYCTGLQSVNMQLDTYEAINGYSSEIEGIAIGAAGERYKTAVIAGRRMFVANLSLMNKAGIIERFGDRIMYSEMNKFDVFPRMNFIDVSKGDAEDYVNLEFFSDRLLAFKQHTLHIINIASPSPSGWFLEQSIHHVGVSYPYSVTKTDFGVAWANQTGCHFFDGRSVIDLTQDKILEVGDSLYGATLSPSWDTFVTGTSYDVKPLAMYIPKQKQLVIVKNPDHGTDAGTTNGATNLCYVYDFKTRSWVFDNSIFTEAEEITNPVVDWNNNVIYGYDVDGSNVKFKQISHTSSTAVTSSFITKDLDFGQPGYVKNIYKIYITYKNSSGNALADDISAAADGSTTFAQTGITTPHSAGSFALTGTFAASQSVWNIAVFSFSSPFPCQSIALKFVAGSAAGISINDISFEYRIIKRRVS